MKVLEYMGLGGLLGYVYGFGWVCFFTIKKEDYIFRYNPSEYRQTIFFSNAIHGKGLENEVFPKYNF